MKFFSLLLFFLFAALNATAADLSVALVRPRVEPGDAGVSVELAVFNSNSAAQAYLFPAKLIGEAQSGSHRWPVVFAREGAERVTILPGAFSTRRYHIDLPADATGQVVLKLVEGTSDLAAAVVTRESGLAKSEINPSPSGASVPTGDTPVVPAKTASGMIERTFANRIGIYEPIYFIYGTHAPSAKFQFSFKYELARFGEDQPAYVPNTLQFAYTQRSLWDIRAESSPFYDSSYMPELMFESLSAAPNEHSKTFITWLGYQSAVRHESNGRAGDQSRSLNTAYFRPLIAIGPLDGWHLVLAPEVFGYLGGLSDNRDLARYRGYGQLRAVLAKNGGPSLLFTGIEGAGFHKPTLQWDLTFPVHVPVINWRTYLLFQYFDGYGESLLHYDQKSRIFRGGVSFVR